MSQPAPVCLVIDDDDVFRGVLAAALERRGYRVATAAGSATAVAEARRVMPHYAVLDLRLDNDSGLQLIGPLKAIVPGLHIVVLTGYASIATAVQAIKLGAVQYLTKPADTDEIITAFQGVAETNAVSIPSTPTPLQHLEWEHIQKTLIACGGNISEAARKLGLHRRTLQRKLQKRPSGL